MREKIFEKMMVGIAFLSLCASGLSGLYVAGVETFKEAIVPLITMVVFGTIAIRITNSYDFADED